MHRPQSIRIAAVVVATLLTLASASCIAFDIIQHESNQTIRSWYATQHSDSAFPVSDTLKCDDDTVGRNLFPQNPASPNCDSDQCWLPGAPGLYVRLNRTLNVTVPEDVEEFIFGEVITAVNRELNDSNHTSSAFSNDRPETMQEYNEDFDWVDFNATSVWPTQQSGIVSKCLDRGEAGYWTMDAVWVCVDAVTSGCNGLDADVAVAACGLAARWGNRNDLSASLLSSWNVTQVDPNFMTESIIEVQNATFEDGESPRQIPPWGSDPEASEASRSTNAKSMAVTCFAVLAAYMAI